MKTPLRWSDAKSTTAAEVSRQRRMLVASEVAARPGVETVPTVEFDMPSVVMVAPDDGSQLAVLASPRCGCSEKSRTFARMASSHGWPGGATKKRGRPKKAAAPTEAGPAPAARKTRDDTKQAGQVAMLRRNEGATLAQMVAATGWQAHTVRGAFAGALKKKLGLAVTSEKVEGRRRVYRIEA